MVEPDSPQMTM